MSPNHLTVVVVNLFLDAIASPLALTPVSGSVSEWVIDSFRFGDSYRISELCELVKCDFLPCGGDLCCFDVRQFCLGI